MLAAIKEHQPSIVYLAYPNNPTANLWDDAVIEKIVEAAPGLVVMDEAYQPFPAAATSTGIAATARAADAHPEQVRPGRRAHRLHDGPAP
jgi:histidinol-phosphate/aromatic aminotransferase/cobyric acid decarboxylase-like protein